jgi:hypothetical protein
VVVFADGRKIPVRYAVVEAGTVSASHRADGTENPDYASAPLQALNNGRVAGVQAAWEGGNGEAYKAGLVADAPLMGLDPAAIEAKAHPMVVRLYDAKQNFGDMGAASNAETSLGLSPTEQAMTDARALPDLSELPMTEAGALSARPGDPFHRQFLQALGMHDAGKLLDSNGQLNKAYMDRLKAAIFAKAYGDDRMVESSVEETNPDARNVLNALMQAAPMWAKVDPSGPLGDYPQRLASAMDLVRQAAASGRKVEDMLAQGDLLARDTRGDTWARFFAKNARSAKRMTDALQEAARMIADQQHHLSNGDMFGAPDLSSDDVTQKVLQIAEDRYGQDQPRPSGSLFNAAGRPTDVARARPADHGPGDQQREPEAGKRTETADALDHPAAAADDAGQPGPADDVARPSVADADHAPPAPGAARASEGARAAQPGDSSPDAQADGGDGSDSAGSRDLERAREALAKHPNATIDDGIPAAEALSAADADVAEAGKQANALQAAISCFLSLGTDA